MAVFGVMSLLYATLTLPEKIINRLPEPEIIVTPYCIPLLKSDLKYESGEKVAMELRGFRIETTVDISDIKFRIENQKYISEWHASSNGMSVDALADLVERQLPQGLQNYEWIFGDIPRLMANTDVEIQFSAPQDTNFNCSSDWFFVSAPNKAIYHRVWPDNYYIRELTYKSPSFIPYKWLFLVSLAGNIGYFIWIKRRRNKNKILW